MTKPKQRKSWDEMSMRVRKEENKVVVETLLRLLNYGTEPRAFLRPLEFSPLSINKYIQDATDKGNTLLRCLFSLPYVQEVRFTTSGDFVVIIYPPFDLEDEIMAGLIASEIKASVDMAAGKKLKEVDDLMAEELFEEIPVSV